MHVSIDIETYSATNIKKSGAYKYAEDPAFDILLFAYAIDDQPVIVLDLASASNIGRELLTKDVIRILTHPDTTLHAYNAAFEWTCLNQWLDQRHLPPIPVSKWRCTMAHAMYCGYPAGLAATGEALGIPQDKRKLGIGGALIRTFCVPQTRLGGTRVMPKDEPEKWEVFKDYCTQDVVAERDIARRLTPWPLPEREEKLWELDCEMNARGVGVDLDLVASAIALSEQEKTELTAEAKAVSGLANPKSVQQLSAWLNAELNKKDDAEGDETDAAEITDLRKDTVAELLAAGAASEKAERMLQIRQLLGKTSTTKYNALEACTGRDGRARGLLQYYGAGRTGRWAGRLAQVQNLPRNYIEPLDLARDLVKARRADDLRMCFGALPDTLSQLIRTALVPRDGREYAVADYSAIEARVVAWLAGEEWVLDVFRTTGKIYEATAAQMFGVPVERIKKGNPEYALRQKGKVAVLACGYGGGPGALVNMGALKYGLSESDLPDIISHWRQANPRTCGLWRDVEDAARTALDHGDAVCARGRITFRREGDPDTNQDFLTATLPNGRMLFYPHPHIAPGRRHSDKMTLHYYGGRKWTDLDTWGGKIVENLTQAVARDCLAETLLALRTAGMPMVFHVHDEVIVEAPKGGDALARMLEIMAAPIPWAPGLPLKGAGFTCNFYQKD